MFKSLTLAILLSILTWQPVAAQKSQPFTFTYNDLNYVGEIAEPENNSKGIIFIIPGDGPTDFVKGDDWIGERDFFVSEGYTIAYWDKAGSGLSEGEYDYTQTIESSAKEALEAIKTIKGLSIEGSDNLGIWGISRAGWVVPKIMELYGEINFWISVSGTTELDNSRYMAKANLIAAGRTGEKLELLMSEWDEYQRILVRGGTLEEFKAKTKNLLADKSFNSRGIVPSEGMIKGFNNYYKTAPFKMDERTNLAIMYPNFEKALENISIPVLAVLGKLDSQVDWKKTGELYNKVARKNKMALTTVYLDNCNHVMQKSETGALGEELGDKPVPCDGYYDSMKNWLNEIENSDQ